MDVRRVLSCMGYAVILFCVQSEENISRGRTAKQISDLSTKKYTASAAVDGCVNQEVRSNCCSHTDFDKENTWWQVDLARLSTISYITLYYRVEENADHRSRFAGYQIFLSNTTDWSKGILCYEDKSSTIDEIATVVTHQCPYVAQYVTVYNYRSTPKRHNWYYDYAVLELCEVQVFGCSIGKYGKGKCEKTCSENCYGGNCDARTGSCFYCQHGKLNNRSDRNCSTECRGCFKNGTCTDCKPGKRGRTCDLDCSTKCKDRVCERDTGFCLECIDGMYGFKCEKKCGDGCTSDKCRRSDGTCEDYKDYKDTCTWNHRQSVTVVSAFAAVAVLCLMTAIISFVCMLRMQTALKMAQSRDTAPENPYEDIPLEEPVDTDAYLHVTSPNDRH